MKLLRRPVELIPTEPIVTKNNSGCLYQVHAVHKHDPKNLGDRIAQLEKERDGFKNSYEELLVRYTRLQELVGGGSDTTAFLDNLLSRIALLEEQLSAAKLEEGLLLPTEMRYLRENNQRLEAILAHKDRLISDLTKRLNIYEAGTSFGNPNRLAGDQAREDDGQVGVDVSPTIDIQESKVEQINSIERCLEPPKHAGDPPEFKFTFTTSNRREG